MDPGRCAALIALLVAGCSGTLDMGDAGGPGRDAGRDASPVDPCQSILCPGDQTCVDGRCRDGDPCEGVTCENPGEVCDRRDGACHSGAADDDGDGATLADGDCDDGDATIHPGAVEACDGVDQDCDLEVDEGYADSDRDGFDTCGFGVPTQADCDDSDPTRSPGAAEACDGVDQDCDGVADDSIAARACTTACGGGEERCVGGAWSCSAPEACECSPVGSTESEGCGSCGTRQRTCEASLRWSAWGPCEGEGRCPAGSSETRSCGLCGLGTERRTCEADCTWGGWSSCSGGGDCAPGDVDERSCGDCGTETRTCGSGCTWSGWSGCVGTGGCSWGYQCRSDGICECGPYPHFEMVAGTCRPSCGSALSHYGLSNDGGGCCAAGCLGAETEPTRDCPHCCEAPPGCL